MKLIGLLVTFLAMAAFAAAVPAPVPEIDANSVATGVALISGALLVARGSRKN